MEIKEKKQIKITNMVNELKQRGYRFTIHNQGTLIRIKHKSKVIEYYPTTETWRVNNKTHKSKKELFGYLLKLREPYKQLSKKKEYMELEDINILFKEARLDRAELLSCIYSN